MYAKSPFASRNDVRALMKSLGIGSRIAYESEPSTISFHKQLETTVPGISINEP